jgi:hypothetical protein
MKHARDIRKRRYIDLALQGWLIASAILVQAALALATLAALRARLLAEIDAGLYRVHHVDTRPVLNIILGDGLWLMLAYAAANLLLMAVLAWVWRRRLARLLDRLRPILARAGRLDFSIRDDFGGRDDEHAVVHAALAWHGNEHDRLAALRERCASLPDYGTAECRARLAGMLALARRQHRAENASGKPLEENNNQL